MSGKSILKTISSLLGGLAISLGVLFILVSLLMNNLTSNLDSLDKIVSSSMKDFVSNNKEDARSFVLQQLEQNPAMKEQFDKQIEQFTKSNLAMPCSNPELVEDKESKAFLTDSGICDIVKDPSTTNEDIKNFMLDKMIEENIDKFDNQDISSSERTNPSEKGKEEIKKAILGLQNKIGSPVQSLVIGLVLVVLGWILTLVSVWFNLVRGFYRICLKTSINLLTTGILLFLFHYLKSDSLVNFIKNTSNIINGINIQNIPDTLLKQVSKVLIDWLQLSTDPLIPIFFIASTPFIIGTIILLFYKRKLDKKSKGPEKLKNLDMGV